MCRCGPLTKGVLVPCNKRNPARNKVRRRQSHSNPPKETMKTRLLLAVAGLAICSALPTFAQQTNTPDPQLRQKLLDVAKNFEEAFNNNDASAAGSALHGGRGSGDMIRTGLRSGGYQETIIRTCSRMCISATMSRRTIRIPLTYRYGW